MISNHCTRIYHAFFIVLMSMMMILIVLLFFEYRFFCTQAHELIILKQQYRDCFGTVESKKIEGDNDPINSQVMPTDELCAAEASDDPDDDDEYIDESFLIINRHPEYLKQSTIDYVHEQELDALMTAIDVNQWSSYTDQEVISVPD